jgi:hypothetical protein
MQGERASSLVGSQSDQRRKGHDQDSHSKEDHAHDAISREHEHDSHSNEKQTDKP